MAASWRNRSPGDVSVELPEVFATPPAPVVAAAHAAAHQWARTQLDERCAFLKHAQSALASAKDELARGIATETGKPLTEALGEMGAVIAKIDLTIADAREHLAARDVTDGPHPARVQRLARGVAAVIAPFNFPLHLGHGANVAHLLAGNPVVFKPSPAAASVAAKYSELMQSALPPGVFGLVQGGADEALALAGDSGVHAVCFTGSVAAGRALARALADDFSKELALELGGRNFAIVCTDADLARAADAVADALCLTCGQRCNATSRVLVDARVAAAFETQLLTSLARYVPGDPMRTETKLGPLISPAAVERYARLIGEKAEWLAPGGAVGEADGKRGNYVLPAVRRGFAHDDAEPFAPILEIESFSDLDAAVARTNATPFGLTTSVFTGDRALFERLADELHSGNIYANLPTTFSPGTLPFGGFGLSGNGRPGGRGFIRFCTEEQAVQWAAW
jgi:acyl-CoA reductase-like NAD-dependent aldehyde dehydrogenase